MHTQLSQQASPKNFPLINKWFTSLAQRGQFLTAVQKATNSAGFVAVRDFMLRKTSQATSKLLEPDDKVAELREPNAKEVQAEVLLLASPFLFWVTKVLLQSTDQCTSLWC